MATLQIHNLDSPAPSETQEVEFLTVRRDQKLLILLDGQQTIVRIMLDKGETEEFVRRITPLHPAAKQ